MGVTVAANFLSAVHKSSNGVTVVLLHVCWRLAPTAYPDTRRLPDTSTCVQNVPCGGNLG